MSSQQLEYLRHSLAHLLAAVVLKLYPDAKLTLGPAIDNGFYYDIDFGDSVPSEKDLPKIEKEMKKILPKWKEFSHKEITQEEAEDLYTDNQYKLELIQEVSARNALVSEGEREFITLYTCNDFTDLCRGGHIDNLSDIDPESFTLDRIAGAYWRGNEKNKMLTRIYGLAFSTKEELEKYKTMREEARTRDHRKLGQELDLFTFSDLVGAGLPLFTPKGTLMRDLIINKIQELQKDFGYQRVTIPHITKKELYETSGHWEKFGDELFKVKGQGDTEFVMKPMNCPHHTQIYASRMRSYRDLPLRFMELGVVYRDEQAGELLGLSRVRSISQDDGHVFCRPDQIDTEVRNIVQVIKSFYTSLGMLNDNEYWVSLSVRDNNTPEKYLGDKETWNKAESILENIAKEEKLPYKKIEGEATFYGPKLDFMFKDALGREWQLGTAQLDFVMPKRFELEYTDTDGSQKTPVMIHRAISGSLERFMSVIIEHFAGHFPVWLSPIQVAILPVSPEAHGTYTKTVTNALLQCGIRAEHHDSNDTLGKRIRNIKLQKVPYIIVVGDMEMKNNTITVEGRSDLKLNNITLNDFVTHINNEINA
ncbi:threonine--tRNA ligase [Candidatus Nomurabacteria bacterium RIFCSPLOWO2_01_FULL_36_10b]|uniref:Threonine--tRNA ligase n=1 Tax=Candidatus Nomurabacteria bacterium RIFCSPLOWO2_01_FULL_36_10b TaxID=1801766 RepID=A0A1F6WQC3_9BACT|nr:MAG: threonine--tRNA ligase [Candidatus Nomurabacteria bacterium RIFCSPLOWO2_01_FULL_36_10b]